MALALLFGCVPGEEPSTDVSDPAVESERDDDARRAADTDADPDPSAASETDLEEAIRHARRRAGAAASAVLRRNELPGRRHAPIDFEIGELATEAAFEGPADQEEALRSAREFLQQLSNRVLATDIVKDDARRRLERALEPVLTGEVSLESGWRYGAPRSEGSGELRVSVRQGVGLPGELVLRGSEGGMLIDDFEFEPQAVGEPRAPRRFEPGPGAAPGGF